MQHIKGLVRVPALRALKALESAAEPAHDVSGCLVHATLVDATGVTACATLLRPLSLLQVLEELSNADALQQIHTARKALHAPLKSSGPLLYVKGTATSTRDEITARQTRFLCRLEGRTMAKNIDAAMEEFVKKLLARKASGTSPTEEELAVYRGLTEGMCAVDPNAAMALAINSELPLLHSGANNGLAKLVDLCSNSAVSAFLESMSPKDDQIPAFETAATQLAARLRAAREQPLSGGDGGAERDAFLQSLIECSRFNIDPGVVYPTDARAIQQWICQFLSPNLLPRARTEATIRVLRERNIQPRRLTLNALSAWCLSDIERSCLTHALGAGVPAQTDLLAAYESSSTVFALKDPRRNLVETRLLHQYGTLLARGDISPRDDSFPSFLEECGECRVPGERPCELSFTMPPPASPSQTIAAALVTLAPRCSFWRVLLQHFSNNVTARIAPCGELLIHVVLPAEHECVQSAARATALPEVPVLYEDDDLLVLNKPAGLATSRHGLSCTQLNERDSVDLMSVLLAGPRGNVLRGVFRQGQVHRLDTGTSGCLLIAKSEAASDSLRHQMGTGGAFSLNTKIYVALCAVLEPSLDRIPLSGLLTDPRDSKVKTKYRITEFFRAQRLALVECRIQQGKKHQIRRHLASAGLPILGDVDHGGAACVHPLASRVALHASSITIVHPTSAEIMCFTAPYSTDLSTAIETLRAGRKTARRLFF